ncbi:MAG: aldehyde dehydrogenase family protein, partial [Solirubrobacteraceae bacterium]
MSTTMLDVPTDHYIGGERVASAQRFPTVTPYTQEMIAEVSRAGEAEVDRAVRAAHDAFPAWAALGATARAAHLHRLADLIDANLERLAAVESADMAMLLRSLRARVIARGALNYRNYA